MRIFKIFQKWSTFKHKFFKFWSFIDLPWVTWGPTQNLEPFLLDTNKQTNRQTPRHWRTMVQDPWMKDVFQNPPMVTYRRLPNLGDPSRMRPKRLIPGMKPCGLNCPTCPFIGSAPDYNPANSFLLVQQFLIHKLHLKFSGIFPFEL